MSIFSCIASHTHAVYPPFLLWSPPQATSLIVLCTDGTGHSPFASSQPPLSAWLLFYDSAPRCFQTCFSHSCWLSQPKSHEQNRPHSRKCSHVLWQGYLLPRWGTGEGLLGHHGLLSYGLTLVPSVTYSSWRSWVGKSQQLWLGWSHYPVGTNHHYWCSF